MPHYKHFGIREHGDFTELQLNDTSYYSTPDYADLHAELSEFIEQQQPSNLIVTFDQIRYCSTALISGMVNAQNRLDGQGGKLKLCGMSEAVRNAFRSLGMDGTVFQIDDVLPAF